MSSTNYVIKRLLAAVAVIVALAAISTLIAVVGGRQAGLQADQNRSKARKSLEAAWSTVAAFEAAGGKETPDNLLGSLTKQLREESIEGFLVCSAKQDEDPLVVYEGPLTHPYVLVLFRSGGIVQWALADWSNNDFRKSAVRVHRNAIQDEK